MMIEIDAWTGAAVKALRKAALGCTQEQFAERLHVTDRTVRNWEGTGEEIAVRGHYAVRLDEQLHALTDLQARRFVIATGRGGSTIGTLGAGQPKLDTDDRTRSTAPGGPYPMEITDMHRRELLRLLSIAATALAAPIDWDRLRFAAATGRVDTATVDTYANLNQALWHDYAHAETKVALFGIAREHLTDLITSLRNARNDELRRRHYELIADTLQLTGEILFDANHHADAAQCYTLSGSYASDAHAYDLWACALTRHAYIGIVDERFHDALPLINQAAHLAQRGDTMLPTRYWVDSVRAQTLAGCGDTFGCQRAFDSARGVLTLPETGTLGWIRFTGSRIDEEHASCYIQLGQPEPAEEILSPMVHRPLSARRRASVLVDLAAAGALRNDPVQAVWYGGAAVDLARHTHSGYIGRRLEQLRHRLDPLRGDSHIDHLDRQIATLTATPA
ncbi:helix-turn-helix domain-containing protein [Nocardia terpenica]|uniref:helix-turn-helix domain-containing protein n=1 Tax=Nocardia terpenica TaxID=455432 RepID=UPI002FE151FE